MQSSKIFLITTNDVLAGGALKAFVSAGISPVLLRSCQDFFAQNWKDACIVFLDLNRLGGNKPAELKSFIGKAHEASVIAMCDTAKISNKEMVEILSSGVDDAISTSIDMTLLIAKTKAYMRRVEVRRSQINDRAAEKWCQDGSEKA